MFNTMKKLALAATVSVIAVAGATASTLPEVSDIDVTASYDAAQDTNAAALFPGIAADIEVAIAERIPQSNNAADPIVRVDIRKIALDGDTILPDSAEFNELEGIVSISTESGNGSQTFPVAIKAVTDESAVPAGYVAIAPSLDDFYTVMVASFADNVAERLGTLNTEGGGSINR